jgi:hypothetical protein
MYIFKIWLKVTNIGPQKTLLNGILFTWIKKYAIKKYAIKTTTKRVLIQTFSMKMSTVIFEAYVVAWILGHLINRYSNVCSGDLSSCV